MATNPSLFAEDKDNTTPLLGGLHGELLEQSPLERLIQQSTAEQREGTSQQQQQRRQPIFMEALNISFGEPSSVSPPTNHTFQSRITTLVAGSLCLLHIGFVWASFLSEAWLETHLIIGIEWQKKYLPFLDDATDKLVHTTNLASLLTSFTSINIMFGAVLLLISLVIPCFAMLLSATWTVRDHQRRIETDQVEEPFRILRITFEQTYRISLVLFFSFTVLNVAASSIELVGNKTDLLVINRTTGGLVCYTIGICCALAVFVVLRLIQKDGKALFLEQQQQRQPTRRVPPNHAFHNHNNPEDEQETPLVNNESQQRQTLQNDQVKPLSFCQKIIIFETGLLATATLPLAYFLPLFHVDFSGLAADFMPEVSVSCHLWEFAAIWRQREMVADTEDWIIWVLGSTLLLLVYVIPLLAMAVTVIAWRSSSRARRSKCRKILKVIQPCLCGLVFALSVIIVLLSIGPVSENYLEGKTGGICKEFQFLASDNCLSIDGTLDIGLIFLVLQSLSLDIFIMLTIAWNI